MFNTLHCPWQSEQQKVEVAVHKSLVDALRLIFDQQQLQLRKCFSYFRQHCRQYEGRDGWNDTESQFAVQGFAVPLRDFDETLDVTNYEARLCGNVLPVRSDDDAAVSPVDELCFQGGFELLNRVTKGRLRNEAPLGRATKVLFFAKRYELAQLFYCR